MKAIHTIQHTFQKLLQIIQENDRVKETSEDFSKINTNSERVFFVYKMLEQHELFPDNFIDEKNDEVSSKFREDGNEKFLKKKLQEAVQCYTQSLMHAKTDEVNYSKAFANRSAALFELELYEECLTDIKMAFKNNYPHELREKLLKRQKNASLKLNSCGGKSTYFKDIPELPSISISPAINCATNAIEIKESEKEGRHIIAKENIKIGDILAIEEPVCQILTSEFFNHCHECLKLSYNLLPCSFCTQALYCNLECRKNAAEKYHKYECGILNTLKTLNIDNLKLLSLKIALSMKDGRYKQINNLIANTNCRSVADLFEKSTTAAVIFYLVKKYTQFFDDEQDETKFTELVLLHFQTAPCNFHEISELAKNEEEHFESREIGAGAFSFLSMFNHSCDPNVVRHCHGSTVVVRAIKSIKKGEQCYDNYGYHFAIMPKTERKNNLKRQYFFDCTCNACEENWPLLKQLPLIQCDTGITAEDITKLQTGDETVAEIVSKKVPSKLEEMEHIQPNRQFSKLQEVLKQCYALLGNVRRI